MTSFISNLFETSYEKEIDELISPEKNLVGTINTQHLEVSDLLKSGKYNPKQFVTTLVKVLKKTTNGNIIINTLSLLDTCIKNAGQGFYLELNTIALIDQIQRILREFDVNVRTKTREYVQYWVSVC
jgi:VHS domain